MRLPTRLLALIAALVAAGGLATALLWPAEPQPLPRVQALAGFTEGANAATGDGPSFADGFLKTSAASESPRFFRPFLKGASGGGEAPTLVSINVTPDASTWRPTASADRQQMVATGTYSDASTLDITSTVTWASGTPTIATISNAFGAEGQVTPILVGPTVITATLGAVSGNETLTLDTARDGPSSAIRVPSNAFQWSMLGYTPTHLFLAQEASGNLADSIGALTLTANATPLYQQTVAGWTRKFVGFSQVAAQRAAAAGGVGPNPATTDVFWLAYMVMDTAPGGVRGVLNIGGNVAVGLVNGSNAVRISVAGVTADDVTTNPVGDDLVHPIGLLQDATNSRTGLFLDEAKTLGTHAAATDGTKGIGAGVFSASPPANAGAVYIVVFTAANARMSDAQIKTLYQTLGWTVPWS